MTCSPTRSSISSAGPSRSTGRRSSHSTRRLPTTKVRRGTCSTFPSPNRRPRRSGVDVVEVANRRRTPDQFPDAVGGARTGAPRAVGLVVGAAGPPLDEHDRVRVGLILVHRDALATLPRSGIAEVLLEKGFQLLRLSFARRQLQHSDNAHFTPRTWSRID